MTVSSTDFKTNLGKYIELVQTEDIYVTKNGKTVGRFTSPAGNKLAALDMITGIISLEDYPENYKEGRLSKQ